MLTQAQVYLSQFASEKFSDGYFLHRHLLASRAVRSWAHHFRAIEKALKPISQRLFDTTVKVFIGAHYTTATRLFFGQEPRAALKSGLSVADVDAITPLWSACRQCLLSIVAHLLTSSPNDLNKRCGSFGYPLHAACAYLDGDRQSIVRLLLDSGADVNAPGGINGSALQIASRRGDVVMAKMLLDGGADFKAQGGVALSWAARYVVSLICGISFLQSFHCFTDSVSSISITVDQCPILLHESMC